MTAIDTQLSAIEKVLAPMREEAFKELNIQNAKGWNDKDVSFDQLDRILFQFAADNMDKLWLMHESEIMTTGAYAVLHLIYQDVDDYELFEKGWNLSALSL